MAANPEQERVYLVVLHDNVLAAFRTSRRALQEAHELMDSTALKHDTRWQAVARNAWVATSSRSHAVTTGHVLRVEARQVHD